MSRTTLEDRFGRSRRRVSVLLGLLVLTLLPGQLFGQGVRDKYQQNRDRQSLFNLQATATAVLRVNQYQCGLANDGGSCLDVFSSPTGGGGFWPTGSPNQYMFRSGIQLLGIVPKAANCTLTGPAREQSVLPECFAWSGDTTAALFNEGTGSRLHGTPLSNIFDSLNPDDLANWPTAGTFPEFPWATAMVEDTALFNPVLIGRKAASQQDTWVLYWDGDPARTGGRVHPLGVLVEQRTLAWNYPDGNEATIYMIYKVTNVTNSPTFQRLNENRFFGGANKLPDSGWRIDSMYMAYDSDPDVAHDFDLNYASAVFPFNVGFAYLGTFNAPEFVYPPALFHAPFFTGAPGLVGIKYLQSPTDPKTGQELGLTSFSLHTNGGAFPDPSTVQRAWRYVSLNVDAGKGDPNCSYPISEIKARRSCFLAQTFSDVRFWIGSGPFSLEPGESVTIAVAQYAAATVATPTITLNADNKPGFPTLAPGCGGEPIRPIEIGAGYIGPKPGSCPEAGGALGQFDVNVVKNSLLGRALVAQSIYDNKFLLGFAPEPPPFYLVPGNNRITVVWEPSPTEDPSQGDPFFAAAGNPANPLFDPNYRRFDVEGYRIYRGTSPADLRLVAQFDKKGTVFRDVLCVTSDPPVVTGEPCTEVNEVDITGDFVQNINVAKLASGDPIVLQADTALAPEIAAGNAQKLSDTGIPFAFVDTDVRNGFQYFYKVTAFDVNSIRSGPSSLESAGPVKSALPTQASPNLTLASFNSFLAGSNGEPLKVDRPLPSIHAENGTFSGPMPPTNAIEGTFAPLVERLLPQVRLEVRIDSVKPGYTVAECPEGRSQTINNCWTMYLTVVKDGQASQVVQRGFTPTWGAFGGANLIEATLAQASVAADPVAASQFGIPPGGATFNAAVIAKFPETIAMSSHIGQATSRGGNNSGNSRASPIPATATLVAGGSRWFSGANETEPDPTRLFRSGHLTGIDTIFSPFSPGGGQAAGMTNPACFGYSLAPMSRAADVEFRWAATGATVVDVTHNVPVPFKPSTQASYGFLVTDADGNGVIDYNDFIYIEGVFSATVTCSRIAGRGPVQLVDRPQLVPVSTGRGASASLTQTGTGFGIYLNGERYIVQTSALPTSGTWTHRSYQGFVTASSGGDTQNPSGYSFTDRGLERPAMIPGLRVVFEVEQATTIVQGAVDLKRVHTVPDPYYATSLFDLGPATKELQFVNMPVKATIRIYSLSGVLVDVVNHDAPEGGGVAKWDLRNRSNQFVASGVYLFHVSTPDGKSHVGKFTVVNSGFAR